MLKPHQIRAGVLEVDLAALTDNWRMFASLAAPAECGAAVKADAYGLGVHRIAPALWEAGCKTFFVALASEALELRMLLPEAVIYVLNGLPPGVAHALHEAEIRPSLCSLEEIREWAAYCTSVSTKLPAGLHIESGINRLGLTARDVESLAAEENVFASFELCLVMSHLASGDDPEAPSNARQLAEFNRLRSKLPPAPASLANSPGTLLASAFHFDLVRPGIGLCGGNPRSSMPSPVAPVAHLTSRLAQVRSVGKGQDVGYGGTWVAERDSRIAVIPVGYADGYQRSLSSDPDQEPAQVWINGHFAPVVGCVSMDMITVDVTDLPDEIAVRGADAELLGAHVLVDDLAARADTIAYEVFTGLGSRFARVYTGYES